MRLTADALIKKHIERWHHLLGMGKWVITYEVLDGPIDRTASVASNHYVIKKNGRRTSHIKFDRSQIKNSSQAERAVVHELLHLSDWGVGNNLHKYIYRLEPKLIMVRRRASRSRAPKP